MDPVAVLGIDHDRILAVGNEFAGHARDRAYAGDPDGHRFDVDLAERLEVTADRYVDEDVECLIQSGHLLLERDLSIAARGDVSQESADRARPTSPGVDQDEPGCRVGGEETAE